MTSVLKNIISISLLLIYINGISQYTLFDQSHSGNTEFSYINDPENKQFNTNHIIKTLASGQNKEIKGTSFRFYYTVDVSVIKGDRKKNHGRVSFKGFVITGDVKYKGFSVTDVLIPASADGTVKIQTKDRNIKTYEIEDIPVRESSTEALFCIHDSLVYDRYDIEIDVQKFYFDNDVISIFDNRISAINYYFECEDIIKRADEKLTAIDINNIDLIPLYNIWIDEVYEITEELYRSDLASKLHLDIYDPIGFITRSDSLKQKINYLHSRLKNDLEKMEVIYYKKALEFIKSGNYFEAEEYLYKSLKFNTKYFPALLMKAKLLLRKDNADEAVKIVNKINESVPINSEEKEILTEHCKEIVDHYLKNAESYILNDNDNEAIEILLKAKKFCDDIPDIICPDELNELIARAKYGIFKSYLQIATKAMSIESYEFAESYIIKAADYQQNNRESILSDAEINSLYGKLIYQCIEKGYAALVIPDFNKAQNYFDRAYRLCNSLDGFKCSQRLIDGINAANQGFAMEYDARQYEDNHIDKGIENTGENETDQIPESIETINNFSDYNRLIAEGDILTEAKQIEEAFGKFIKAKQIETKFNIKPNPDLDKLISDVAKPALLSEIKRSKFIVWKNEIDSAQKIYQYVAESQIKYNMTGDTELNTALSELHKNIEAKICFNVEAEYSNTCLKALREIRRAKFTDALTTLNKAIRLKKEHPACIIIDDYAEKILEKYEPLFDYCKHMDQAKRDAKEKKYNDAIINYKKASELFNTANIDTLGIALLSLTNFITSYNDKNFIIYGIEYCLRSNDYQVSLSLLKTLKRMDISAKETRLLQVSLANRLAEIDSEDAAKIDPAQKLAEHININDEWFRYFREAYLGSSSFNP